MPFIQKNKGKSYKLTIFIPIKSKRELEKIELESRNGKQGCNIATPSWMLCFSLCLLWLKMPLFPEPISLALAHGHG